MKERCKKLLALLICVALSVTDILPVGFSVSASELEQSDLIPENNEELVDNLLEESAYESKSSTDWADFGEESVHTEEAVTKENGGRKEEISAEDTQVQEEGNDKNNIEIETQEGSAIIEETENNNMESDTSEQVTGQEFTETVTASGNNIASGSYKDITWVIDAEGKLTVTGTGEFIIGYKPEDGYEAGDSLWYDYSNSIVSAEINVTGAKNASNMFYGCSNLTSVDMSGFDTSNVMSMGYMFYGCSNLASVDMSSFDTRNVTNMSDMFWNCSSLESLDLSSFDTRNVTNMGDMFSKCISLVNIDVSGFDTRDVTNMSGMFWDCSSLTSVDISSFDTRNVIDMSWMFFGCSSLTNVDVSGFDTRNVTDMGNMFVGCGNLTNVDVSGFDTGNVTDMSGMFSECSGLTSVDVSGFDTRNVTDMSSMFSECSGLTSVDVSSFDTKNVTNMGDMFSECSSLVNIDVSGFDTRNVTDMNWMFGNCRNLTSLDVTGFITGSVTDMSYMFYNCRSLTSVNMSNLDVGNVIECENLCAGCTDLTTIYTPCNLTKSVSLPTEKIGDVWYQSDGTEITELPRNLSYSIMITKNSVPAASVPYIIAEKVKTVYQCGELLTIDDLTVRFYGTDGTINIVTDYSTNKDEIDMSTPGSKTLTITYNGMTTDIELTITQLDSDNIASGSYRSITWVIDSEGKLTVTGSGEIFEYSYTRAPWYDYKDAIISAQITVTDIYNVSGMFFNYRNLEKLDLSGLDTSNVTNMSSMFSGCSSLKSIDLSGFDTRNVIYMSSMFSGCSSLKSIDLSGLDTKNVTDMSCMFLGCRSLTSINLSGFDTRNVTDMSSMFSGCNNLISIDVSGFDTENVTDMPDMFGGCSSLTSIDVSGFDTANVTDMNSMFAECSSLTSIDVSGFNTRSVVYMSYLFENCSKLTYLDLSNFDLGNFVDEEIEKDVDDMLEGCINLATIHTPCNLTQSVPLPKTEAVDTWYQFDGTQITELPQNLGYSIIIAKNSVPSILEPYITAKKEQTFYECRDILDLSDLKVMYHNVDGTVWEVNDFSTNKDEIDMSTAGVKTLNIFYNNLETTIKLNVKQYIASGSYEGITWIINSKGKLIVKGTGDFAEPSAGYYDVDVDRAPWFVYKDSIISAEVNVTGMTDASYMFNECRNLKSIELGGLDTGSITSMSGMFCRCESLEEINVSKFNTENVTDMGGMFYRCLELTSIDVSSFDTSKVTDMSDMFGECWSLETLDVSGFNTSKVTSMWNMFWSCWSLETIDVSGFDTSKVTSMYGMFWSCWSLKTIDVSGFDTSKVTSMSRMFAGCLELTCLDMSGFDVSNVTDSSDMLSNMMYGECGVTTIYTPYNLKVPIELTSGNWYQPDGTVITELPRNLPYSILITVNTIPTVSTPHIAANKVKNAYTCGDTLNTDDLTVRFYDTDGTVKAVTDYTTNADTIDMSTVGTKTLIITYNNLTAEIKLTVTGAQQEKTYTVIFDLCGHGTEIAPITDIIAGSLITKPQPPVAEGYRFIGWYKDLDYIYEWNFNEDTVQENITLYAYWIPAEEDDTKIGSLFIKKIPEQSYTGSAIKPTVAVYYQSDESKTLLKAGTDNTIKYYNNIEADTEQEKTLGGTSQTDSGNGFTKDLAYIVITCKGNYTGSVYQNFHINPVSITGDGQNPAKGFTLKYTEQFANSTKLIKPFSSIKYKKAMKAGTDYNVKLTVQQAYDTDGNVLAEGSVIDQNSDIPTIPTGYQGTFLMTITGINNYRGTITKTIYVADKNHLMKNASVSLGKNQKNMKYTGDAVTLTPAWYDDSIKEYYVISEDGKRTEADKNDVFTIKIGTEYLLYGRDFTVGYQSNKAVGTATMTIVGIGDYVGTKNVTFRITGTAFNAKNIRVSNMSASLIYTGEALTQNEVVLTDINGTKLKELVCNTDYTVSYKNNIKKGTATMIFTANPISGYSGSFKQTFKITTAGLSEITDVTAADLYNDVLKTENGNLRLEGKIIYTKEGARPSERVVLTNRNTNSVLKEGTDYTVSYVNNKAVTTDSSLATMTIKGKGNYAGIITVSFPIIKASLSENENLTVTTTSIAYNAEKADDYQYRPQIKLSDQKKALSASKDYEVVEYRNCSQTAVKSYLEATLNGTATEDARPYAIIKAREESGYDGTLAVDLTIYQTKLTDKNLYIVVSTETEQVTYTGKQVKPEVTVYYGEAEAIKLAKAEEEIKENILTDKSGSYGLTKLTPRRNGIGDYTLVYGANITAGINKGSVTVNGTGLYGGKVTAKFTILGKDVHGKIVKFKYNYS